MIQLNPVQNINSPNQTADNGSSVNNAGGNITIHNHPIDPKETPIIINEQEIKDLILDLKEIIKPKKLLSGTSTDFARGDNFMEKKNLLNNLPDTHYSFYKEKLTCSEDISNFLGDPKNSDTREIYFTISDEITQSYQARKSNDSTVTIEAIFTEIYNKMAVTLGKDRMKMWYLISHMYFNCDIGIK